MLADLGELIRVLFPFHYFHFILIAMAIETKNRNNTGNSKSELLIIFLAAFKLGLQHKVGLPYTPMRVLDLEWLCGAAICPSEVNIVVLMLVSIRLVCLTKKGK